MEQTEAPVPGSASRPYGPLIASAMLVALVGSVIAVSLEVAWATRNGWPGVPPRPGYDFVGRIGNRIGFGMLISMLLWSALTAVVCRLRSVPLGVAHRSAVRPFLIGLALPLFLVDLRTWRYGVALLALSMVVAMLRVAAPDANWRLLWDSLCACATNLFRRVRGTVADFVVAVKDRLADFVVAVKDRLVDWPSLAWTTTRSCTLSSVSWLRARLVLDANVVALLLLFSAICLPTLTRALTDARRLTAYSNDEPMITQQLLGMAWWPIGNPGNAMQHPEKLSSGWNGIRYWGVYYGGTYLDLAFVVWAPMSVIGLPEFPTAPLLLRFLSFCSALLTLLVVYNIGKSMSGRLCGTMAALLLMSDTNFGYYASLVHPDMLQTALMLIAVWVAVDVVHLGGVWRVIALGTLAGLVQGSKMGGPMLVPVAAAAVALSPLPNDSVPFSRRASARFIDFVLLGVSSIFAYVISTPYAFIDPFFYNLWKEAWSTYQEGPFGGFGWRKWLEAIYAHGGPLLTGLQLLVAIDLARRLVKRELDAARGLTAIFAVSVVVWNILAVKVWVHMAYLLPALAGVALLVSDLLARVVHCAWKRSWPVRASAVLVLAILASEILFPRIGGMLVAAVRDLSLERSTTVEIGRWALQHVPPDARIVVDDIAYFPPVFTNYHHHGGLLNYDTLAKLKPDYFTLCGSIYNSQHYLKLRKTQTFTRGAEGPVSVLLYQDLLDRGGVPGCDLVAEFKPTPLPTRDRLPYGLHNVFSYLALSRPETPGLIGPEIRLYRYKPTK